MASKESSFNVRFSIYNDVLLIGKLYMSFLMALGELQFPIYFEGILSRYNTLNYLNEFTLRIICVVKKTSVLHTLWYLFLTE